MDHGVLYLIPLTFFLIIAGCAPAPNNENKQTDDGQDTSEVPAGHEEPGFSWEQHKSESLNLQLEYPSAWQTFKTDSAYPFRILNFYHSTKNMNVDLPIAVHTDASVAHVSFYPDGYGTEMPFSRRKSLDQMNATAPVGFPVVPEGSVAFMLENGEIWGYLLRSARSAPGWSDNGFLFAQIAVRDFEMKCFDKETGGMLSPKDCDPMAGDSVAYHGNLDEESKTAVFHILKTLEFTSPASEQPPMRDMLQVEQPLPNEDVTSPLTIKGKARGTWYFEGSFPVVLLDKDRQPLARGVAEAQSEWMTEDWVPFEATLEFETPGDERGSVKFEKANPSGMPSKDRSYERPVIFVAESRRVN